MPEFDFLLVLPAYRELSRLPPYFAELADTLSVAEFSTALLVVDDGSPSAEQEELRRLLTAGRTGNCTVLPPLTLTVNQGKGGAVLAGWRSGVTARWLAFADADGAVPAGEVARVFAAVHHEGECQRAGEGTAGWFAARDKASGRKVRRRWHRGWLGKIFARLAGLLLGMKIRDSQCGFKIVDREWFSRIDARVRERGFCFDLDLWLALREADGVIVSVPVDWQERTGGKLRLWRDGPLMLSRLWRLREKYKVQD